VRGITASLVHCLGPSLWRAANGWKFDETTLHYAIIHSAPMFTQHLSEFCVEFCLKFLGTRKIVGQEN